jgi:predicted DNA-binding helix-hairpin-helix protein
MEKLALAACAAEHEVAQERRGTPRTCGSLPSELRRRFGREWRSLHADAHGSEIPVTMAVTPGGRLIPLLKAMQTTACERDCRYCGLRAGRDERRVTFQPEELARLLSEACHRGLADGIFISAGIVAGGANTQNRLLDTAEILRHRLHFRGYLHLKILPGAEAGQVVRAMQLADRVSVNLEAPNPQRLECLAPRKDFAAELLAPLRWIESARRAQPPHMGWGGRWPSSTTQFVVGAAGESDLEILGTVDHLQRTAGLARAYFVAFTPVPGTPLENMPAGDPLREHRLYQASFLLRDYGFDLEDLTFAPSGSLPRDIDPKLAYARQALVNAPVEVNRASREELLRVPGIGPHCAAAILAARRLHRLRDAAQLSRLGVVAERAAPYVTLDGHRAWQPSLFAETATA